MTRRELDCQRAADALAFGIAEAARIHSVSETAIRRARRDHAEHTYARQLLALLSPATNEGTQQS